MLFLFVVMMLDVDFAELRQGFLQYLPIGALIGCIFLAELLLVVGAWTIGPDVAQTITAPIPPIASVTNTEALGRCSTPATSTSSRPPAWCCSSP